MIFAFLILTFSTLTLQQDPCASCQLPTVLPEGDSSLCGNFNGTGRYSSMTRFSDATGCYLHVTGCDIWNVLAGNVCFIDNLNVRSLKCINGVFNLIDGANIAPVTGIRCLGI